MAQKFAYSMYKVSKMFPPNKQVLRDISLSFFHGAKIGVLGLNGSGKSTLLNIMAGEDKNYNGDARPSDGITVGYLKQEPQLDPQKTVRDCVLEGMGDVVLWLKRFNEIGEQFADPNLDPDKMEKLLAEQATIQEKIDHANGWDLDRTIEIAMDALRLPPGDANVKKSLRRREASCGSLPFIAAKT
jgi:ATPase subunit of ABC transporter with duplicated ATPase domains